MALHSLFKATQCAFVFIALFRFHSIYILPMREIDPRGKVWPYQQPVCGDTMAFVRSLWVWIISLPFAVLWFIMTQELSISFHSKSVEYCTVGGQVDEGKKGILVDGRQLLFFCKHFLVPKLGKIRIGWEISAKPPRPQSRGELRPQGCNLFSGCPDLCRRQMVLIKQVGVSAVCVKPCSVTAVLVWDFKVD